MILHSCARPLGEPWEKSRLTKPHGNPITNLETQGPGASSTWNVRRVTTSRPIVRVQGYSISRRLLRQKLTRAHPQFRGEAKPNATSKDT